MHDFLLSAALSPTGKVICVSLALLLLPVFSFQVYSRGSLRLYFTGAFQNAYLWADYAERRIGRIYLEDWKIIAAEFCLIFGGVLIGIIRVWMTRESARR